MERDEEILIQYLSSLQNDNETYIKNISAINKELEKKPEFIKNSEIKAQETRTRLENQYIDLERSANELDRAVKSLTDEITNLKNTKAQIEEDLMKYNQYICEANTKIQVEKDEIVSLVDEFSKVAVEKQAADNAIYNIILKIEKERTEADTLIEKNKILEAEVKNTQVLHKPGQLNKVHQICATEHDKNTITSMVLGQGSNSIVVCTSNCKVYEFMIDARSESMHAKLPAVPNSIKRYPSTNQSAIAFNNGLVGLFDHSCFKFTSPLVHRCFENAVDIDWISRTRVIATSQDRSMRIFDFARADSISVVKTPFQASTICRGSAFLVAGAVDGTVAMLDTRDSSIPHRARLVPAATVKVAAPAIGPSIFSLHTDGSLICLDERNPTTPLFLVDTELPTRGGALAVSPLSQLPVVCGTDGRLRQYTTEGELLREMKVCDSAITSCACAENAIVLVHDSQIIDIWTS